MLTYCSEKYEKKQKTRLISTKCKGVPLHLLDVLSFRFNGLIRTHNLLEPCFSNLCIILFSLQFLLYIYINNSWGMKYSKTFIFLILIRVIFLCLVSKCHLHQVQPIFQYNSINALYLYNIHYPTHFQFKHLHTSSKLYLKITYMYAKKTLLNIIQDNSLLNIAQKSSLTNKHGGVLLSKAAITVLIYTFQNHVASGI